MKNSPKKFYSVNQIYIGTFIGGPLIGGYMLGKNFELFGRQDRAKYSYITGILSIFVLLVLNTVMRSVGGKSASTAVSFLPVAVAFVIANYYQKSDILRMKSNRVEQESSWGVFFKSLGSFVVLLLCGYVYGLFIQ